MLLEHIEHENLQVRTYINGTLYSLLTRPTLKEQALAFGMPEMLKHLLATADEQIARQLRYIMDQLESDQTTECVSDTNEDAMDFEDDDNYDTEMEEEVDPEILNAGVQTGEQLLQEFSDNIALEQSSNLGRSGVPTPVKDSTTRKSSASASSTCSSVFNP